MDDKIIDVVRSLKLGDKIILNDFKAKFTVCGLSPNFVLAHYGQRYTIIERTPMPKGYLFNGVREGDLRCSSDWWIFGYKDGYDFTSAEWVKQYMRDLEEGTTELSVKHQEPVFRLSVVDHTDKVYRNPKAVFIKT